MSKKYKKLEAYPKVSDLTGLEVNQLKVLYLNEQKTKELQARDSKYNYLAHWICRCSCGNLISIRSDNLTRRVKSKQPKSCGCHKKKPGFYEKMKGRKPAKFNDLTDQIFGNWLVLYRDLAFEKKLKEKKRVASVATRWRCRCICNTERTLVGSNLILGQTKSCGCYQKETAHRLHFKDLSKQRFGMLVVVDRNLEYQKALNSKQTYWNCICDCTNTTIVAGGKLKNKDTTSCGCNKSRGEFKIKTLLTTNNIAYKQEYIFKDCLSYNNKSLRFDFAIVTEKYNAKYLIEFDGEQHFREYKTIKKEGWGNFATVRLHDNKKNKYCFDNKIPLIRIPYTERNNILIEDLIPETSQYLITPDNVEDYYKKYDKK